MCVCGGGGGGQGGGGGTETKTVCQTVASEVKYKTATIYQCKVCVTINISKYVNTF